MKTPTARKTNSGNWRCEVMLNGVRKSFTAYTKAEAEQEAIKWKLGQEEPIHGTLREAMERYIANREAILSPSTIRRYRKFVEDNFKNIQNRAISSLSQAEIQKDINLMRKSYSPKTIKNAWGFLSSVLKENGRSFNVTLPQVVSDPHPFLQPDQIKPFIEEIEGYKLELPILLALHGLRRSEIMDLEWKDIDLKNGALKVSGAAVLDSDGVLIHKQENKNTTSRRTVPILIPRLATLLATNIATGSKYVATCNPNSIYNAVNRACDKLGYPRVGVHGLRHTFVSLCYHRGISELGCMQLCGFADFQTMRKVYTHLASKDLEIAKDNLSEFFTD